MTKKDYIKIAKVLKDARAPWTDNTGTLRNDNVSVVLATLASDFADMLARDNPNFDRRRFLEACQ